MSPVKSASLQESKGSKIFQKDLLCSESAEMVSVLRRRLEESQPIYASHWKFGQLMLYMKLPA
jgi:hypothetical protein